MISYLLPLPDRGHMTSTVHNTILLFIYTDGSRGIFGPVVFSFDDLKFLFVLFPFEQFPNFASDFTNRNSWAPLALCVGVLCFRVMHEDVCL